MQVTRVRTLSALRAVILRSALTILAIAMPIIGAVMVAQLASHGRLRPFTLLLCAFTLTFPALRLVLGRLSFRTAALSFAGLMLVGAFLVQIRGGLTAGATAVQLVGIVLTGLLFGKPGAVAGLAASLVSSALAGWLVVGGYVPPITVGFWDPTRSEVWVRSLLVLGFLGATAVVAVVYVVEQLEAEARSLRAALEREQQEREARARAEEERERTQAALERAHRMEAIGQLAGGVAHDFNNLLTVVLSCTELLRSTIRAGRAPGLQEVEEIQQAGERARDLTRQLLAFARKEVAARVPMDLDAVVRGCERLLRRTIGEGVALEVRLREDPWAVLCDPRQVEQVVMNLATNARDAMAKGGTLAIETRNATCDARGAVPPEATPGEYVQLAMRDAGSGLSPEAQAHLFEPFTAGAGTGMGLATVHGIVTQSGGHLHVDSAEGRGTTITVCLPRTDAPIPAPPPRGNPHRASGGTETVLVVEDEAAVRAVTVRTLRAAGYRVLEAGGGREALEIAASGERIDLLVSDVVMPGVDGRVLAERLLEGRPGLPVLFVSGYPPPADGRKVLDPEAEMLQKPFSATALLDRVRVALEAGAASRAAAS